MIYEFTFGYGKGRVYVEAETHKDAVQLFFQELQAGHQFHGALARSYPYPDDLHSRRLTAEQEKIYSELSKE